MPLRINLSLKLRFTGYGSNRGINFKRMHEQHVIPNLPLGEKSTYEREYNETINEKKLK